MKNRSFLLVLLLCVLGDSSHAADGLQQQYVSADLVKAIQELKADTFFSPDVQQSEAFKNFGEVKSGGRLDPEKSYQSNLFNARYLIDAQHYQELADKTCQQIEVNYENDLKNVKGSAGAYAFTNQITKAFESAGAYALPIQIEGKKFQAEYYNLNWDKSASPDILGGNEDIYQAFEAKKYKGDKPGKIAFEPSGFIVVKSELDRNKYNRFSPLNTGISDFHLWMTKDHDLETRNFNLKYDLVQSYLFVFHQNQADLNSEQIFLYVDVPYSIHSGKLGASPIIEASSEKESIKCYAVSSSLAKSVGGFEEFKRGKKSNSLLVSLAPLTVPLSAGYQKKNENSAYPIKKEIISSPSLQCFMALQGLDTLDVAECSLQD